jgi:hypothetical protein
MSPFSEESPPEKIAASPADQRQELFDKKSATLRQNHVTATAITTYSETRSETNRPLY